MPSKQPAERTVSEILNFQREESEARDIIKDLDNLHSILPEKRGRWIWELIQNAKDCARPNREGLKSVSITIILDKDKLIFQHDGVPFKTDDLIALLRRTSNKNYQNAEGNTGKYGTGFVTTHILSKIVHLDAFLIGEGGQKNFKLTINRSFDQKEALQHELVRVFAEVEKIRSSGEYPPHVDADIYTRFIYPLDPKSLSLAQHTLEELTGNIHFTLRCNTSIKSVTVDNHLTGLQNIFRELPPEPLVEGITYFSWGAPDATGKEEGLLYFDSSPLKLGLPVTKQDGQFAISEMGRCARLFKDLPMIGTENAHIPFWVQGDTFRPPEPRDGLRTTKSNEEEPDQIADANRSALGHLPNAVKTFYQGLCSLPISGLHLLVETGLPDDPYNHLDHAWYIEHIQVPLRNFFREQPIVETASGERKPISECFFIDYPDHETRPMFNRLVSKLSPAHFPNASCFEAWDKIIHQESEGWTPGILFSLEALIDTVDSFKEMDAFPFEEESEIIQWLNELYSLLKQTHQMGIADTKAIFPSQAGTLQQKVLLKTDNIQNEQFKNILWHLGHPVRAKLLHNDVADKTGFEPFDQEGFLLNFHKAVGNTTPSKLEPELIEHLLLLVSMFRTKNAPARMELYRLLKGLLGDKVPPITDVTDMEFYDWSSPDILALKYACWLVEQASTLATFADRYFQSHISSAVEWLNGLYRHLHGEEDRWALSEKFKIFLVQSGKFEKFNPSLRAEDSIRSFPDLFKKLNKEYKAFTKQLDPYDWLTDSQIEKDYFPHISLSDFIKPLDDLFIPEDAEAKVRDTGTYNSLFHELNNYCNEHEEDAKLLLPTFVRKQAELLLKAMGESVSRKVMIVNKMGRSEEDLQTLKELTLPATTLVQLEQAAQQVGGPSRLIEQAGIMLNDMEQAQWRKEVGTRAEIAFLEAMKDVKVELLEIDNPDEGRDFTLKLTGGDKIYSVEIKSTGIGLDAVSMSKPQGDAACENPKAYALCVVPRDDQNQVSVEHFKEHARFKEDIGNLLEPKMQAMKAGLNNIEQQEDGDVTVALNNKKYSIFVKRKIWSEGQTFNEFLGTLKTFFKIPV